MKFAGQRLECCVVCGGKLPGGSRIDRKYCREACIERAYYQRHPEKSRVPGSRRSTTRETGADSNRSPYAPARPVQHTDQAHNDLRRPPNAAQNPTAAQAMAPRATGQPSLPDNANVHALASARQEIERLKQQLQAAADREGRIQKELAALREQHQRDAMAQAAALTNARHQHTSELEQARQAVRTKAEAQETRNSAPRPHPPAMATAQLSPPPASVATPQVGNRPRPPLPWELPSRQQGAAPVPKWLNMAPSELEKIRQLAESVLSRVPGQMRQAGSKADAKMMSGYIGTTLYAPMFRKLSFPVILRIGCTDEIHRQTVPQKEALAKAVLQDAIEALTQEGYPLAMVLRKELADNSPPFFRLALELVTACRDWVLKS